MPDDKKPVDQKRLILAKEIIALLEEEPSRVLALNQESDKHCCDGNFAESIECCREAYELAVEQRDAYGQGAARLHMGLHYFVLHKPDFDRAADMCEEASRCFHTAYRSRAEIVALLASARILRYACNEGKDRWHQALSMYLRAVTVEGASADLSEIACQEYDALAKAFSQATSAQEDAKTQSVGVSQPETLPGSESKKEEVPMNTLAPHGPHGNYAIAVACHDEQPKQSSSKFSRKWLLLIALGLLAIGEILTAMILLEDMMAKILVLAFFVATLGTFVILLGVLGFRVKVPPGHVGVITGGANSPRFLAEGSVWLKPFGEHLYDLVPLGQHEYKCRLEFREYESASPIIFQEIIIQYRVVRSQLGRAVVNHLTNQEDGTKHLTAFWEAKLARRLQRFFEDMSPQEIEQALDAPHALESKIFEALRTSAIRQSWGIEFVDPQEDVHLGFYRNEKKV